MGYSMKKKIKSYHDSERLLETYYYLKWENRESVNGQFNLTWKTPFSHGMSTYKKETIFGEFFSNLNALKRLSPDEFMSRLCRMKA